MPAVDTLVPFMVELPPFGNSPFPETCESCNTQKLCARKAKCLLNVRHAFSELTQHPKNMNPLASRLIALDEGLDEIIASRAERLHGDLEFARGEEEGRRKGGGFAAGAGTAAALLAGGKFAHSAGKRYKKIRKRNPDGGRMKAAGQATKDVGRLWGHKVGSATRAGVRKAKDLAGKPGQMVDDFKTRREYRQAFKRIRDEKVSASS